MTASLLPVRSRRSAEADSATGAIAFTPARRTVFLCVLCVLLRLAFPAQAQRPLGIDVSDYQGTIDWVAVKNSGISFAWAKATEGYTANQINYATYAVNAKAAGVLFGTYHYARPDLHPGAIGAQTEAQHMWSVSSNYIKPGGFYLQPMLDIEADLTGAGYTTATLSQWVNDFCNYLVLVANSNGIAIKPVVYTYVSYSSTWLNTTVTNWPLWMAQYPVSPLPQTGNPSGTAPWPAGSWQCWQYSSTGVVPGIAGNCDLDVCITSNALTSLVIGGLGAPSLTTQPILHRATDIGGSVSFAATAAGNAPLKYQWRLNGVNISNATNAALNLVNAQTNNSGFYTLVVTNSSGAATSSPVSLLVYPQQAQVFADNFDVNSAANWIFNKSSADTATTFAFDYSTLGIPSAPNSGGSTLGVQMKANLANTAVAALSLSPTNKTFAGDYRLRFDGWINVNGPLPGGIGSTEFLTAGVGTSGTRTEWTGAGSTADGYYFSVNGDGGSSDTSTTFADYNAYSSTTAQLVGTGDYWAGTDVAARGNGNAYYQSTFPSGPAAPALQQVNYPQQSGNLNSGTFGLAWHDVIVSRRGNVVDWAVDGIRIATISNATFTASNVFVGFWDPFASLSSNNAINFGLVDNVRVEQPAVAPVLVAQPFSQWATMGSNVTLTASASGLPVPVYQWKFNGTNIAASTNTSLLLSNLQGTNAGLYSVFVTNISGTQTSSNAVLSLIASTQPTMQLAGAPAGGSVQLDCLGQSGATYALETSTDLVTWTTLTNIVAPAAAFSFTPSVSTDDLQRYYRLRSGP